MPTTAIIILAAGSSTRMHLPKQLLPYKRKSLLQHVIDEALASKADDVCIVLGAHAIQIRKSIRPGKARILLNDEWPEGMASSIRTGIGSLADSIDSAVISLCDQPLLTSTVFNTLIETFSTSGKSIVACEYDGFPGVPVLFARNYFHILRELRGDAGARTIIQSHREATALIPFAGGSVDLDTPEEFQEFIKRRLQS